MIAQAAARSISRQVKTWLDRGQSVTRTVSVFKSACNLVTDGDEVIALVTPSLFIIQPDATSGLNIALNILLGLFGVGYLDAAAVEADEVAGDD